MPKSETESPAFQKMQEAFNKKRREWYGDAWESLSWFGLPKDGGKSGKKEKA